MGNKILSRRLLTGAGFGLALAGFAVGALAADPDPTTGAKVDAAAETAPVEAGAPSAADLDFFEKKVRPVLAESCFGCHNSSSKSPMGALVLDHRAGALKGGDRGPSVVPGNLEKSLLIKAVRYDDTHFQMPPKGKLPAAQIADLEAWVKMGAPWPASDKPKGGGAAPAFDLKARAKHWSFQPLKRTAVPKPKNAAWVRTPVDAFVLAKLEAGKLAPSKPADRRTLIRRISYDLIGLPPTPEEVAAFVNDKDPKAYEKVVERLLASPQYGERWGRHWLDLMRFAETDGHEFDFEKPNAYQYRDYVTRAFNADVPYKDLVVEHLAGDLVTKPRTNPKDGSNESIIGTGFWFLGEGKHSPVDLVEDESERVDNQIDVASKSFLGLSMGCARCHDHKFDPISAKDYYALAGFLKSSRQQFAAIDAPEPIRKSAAEIAVVNAQLAPALVARTAEANRARLEKMPDYLLAAREVLRANTTAAPAEGDILFEDFEKGYGEWKATGTAFGDQPNEPPFPSHQGGLNQLGKGVVNTHSALKGGQREVGDHTTGTLTSPTFTVKKPYIRFLVGGGKHATTCVNLVVGGKAVRTATGKELNGMEWAFWDVRDLAGKQAQIQVVDQVAGHWGNIGLDHVLFSDHASAYTASVAKLASERKLDGDALMRWVKHLRETAAKNASDPFHAWARLATAGGDFAEQARALASEMNPETDAACAPAGSTVFEDFSGNDYKGWFVTGEAFGSGPARTSSVRIGGDAYRLVEAVFEPGVAYSAGVSDRLQGALRSKTFKLEKSHILFRAAGKGVTINLIIDSFQRIRYPIYGGLTLTVNSPNKMAWHDIDMGKWAGHRAYIEILDEGRGYIALDQIAFSDTPAPAPKANGAVAGMLKQGEQTAEAVAARYRDLFVSANDAFAARRDEDLELVNWLLRADPTGANSPACDPTTMEAAAKRGTLENAVPEPRRVIAIADGTPENEHVHIRGSHKTLGPEVPRRFLEAFSGTKPLIDDGSGRLSLALRMVNSPLAPRVMVNRLWMHHFGEGLVKTPDDFGLRGEKPTHPEMLEWLSSEFIRQGWSMKQMHRMMVLSNTYRQASRSAPAIEAADPQNRLLHRMPVRRLEAEAIRDGVLAVSGKLDRTLYGPSVLPFLTPFMEGRGRPAASGPLDGANRRSLYISVRRNFLSPMFLAFDYPIPFNTMGRRSISTVPGQALVLMNNPFVIQQAEAWAKRTLDEPGKTPRERLGKMYETAFSRPPSETETAQALAFIEEQKRRGGPDAELKAWSDFAHVLFNVKEFIFVN